MFNIMQLTNTVLGVYKWWLALVVCLPHRLGIFSTISKGSDKSNADWYNSFQTDSSSRSARNNSMTALHSFVASSRSHSIPCRNFDRNTVLCKMCSDTTRAITITNLVIDARYCPVLSSPSPCNRCKWCFKCIQCVGSTRPSRFAKCAQFDPLVHIFDVTHTNDTAVTSFE